MTADHDPGARAQPVRMHPYRWGDPARPATLSPAVAGALGQLGVQPPVSAPVDVAEISLPEAVLAEDVRTAL